MGTWHTARLAIESAGGLITATGIARMRSVTTSMAHYYTNLEGFPRPFRLNGFEDGDRVWLHAEVDEWMTERFGPLYGPPIEEGTT